MYCGENVNNGNSQPKNRNIKVKCWSLKHFCSIVKSRLLLNNQKLFAGERGYDVIVWQLRPAHGISPIKNLGAMMVSIIQKQTTK
jgi:hypothetical protein